MISPILDYLRFLNSKTYLYKPLNNIDLIDVLIESIEFNSNNKENQNSVEKYNFIYNNLNIVKEYIIKMTEYLNKFINNEMDDNLIVNEDIEIIKYYRSKIINKNNYKNYELYHNLDTYLEDIDINQNLPKKKSKSGDSKNQKEIYFEDNIFNGFKDISSPSDKIVPEFLYIKNGDTSLKLRNEILIC